jgi:hypothetical protein
MLSDDQTHTHRRESALRAAHMTTLIPDARRGLLGGLIDDASLVGPNEPSVAQAVATYRARRAGPTGWMVGRFVVPTSRLEELALVLVRTMAHGEAPWSIVAVFDGRPATDTSIAASFHATMNPAASVDVVHLVPPHDERGSPTRGSAAAAAGIHHGVLPMTTAAALGPINASATAKEAQFRSVGIAIEVDGLPAADLASSIATCARDSVPFTLSSATLPGHTIVGPNSGTHRYGAINLLASSLSAETANETAMEAALCDTNPAGYSIGFSGLVRHGRPVRASRPLDTDRAPLVSIAASEPDEALASLGLLESSR